MYTYTYIYIYICEGARVVRRRPEDRREAGAEARRAGGEVLSNTYIYIYIYIIQTSLDYVKRRRPREALHLSWRSKERPMLHRSDLSPTTSSVYL